MSQRLLSATLLLLNCFAFCGEDEFEKAAAAQAAAKKAVYAGITAAQESGFERLGEPKSGGWLSLVAEMPQTFDEFKKSKPPRATTERYEIVLLPLGKLEPAQRELLIALKDYAAAFFQLPARVAEPLDIDLADKKLGLTRIVQVDRFKKRTEYDSDKILDVLATRVPDNAAVYMAFADVELFQKNDNMHGLASLTRRVGVLTLKRLFPADTKSIDAEALRRTCRFVSHEIGHNFGLSHCVFYRCAMNGCSNLAEAETSPLHFCPVCHQKLQWLLGFDAAKRYAALQEFYEKHGLKAEAGWTEKKSQTSKVQSPK